MDLEKVAVALRGLADALVDPGHSSPALAPEEPEPQEEAADLEALQEAGANLLKTGKRAAFVAFLAKREVKSLSGIAPTDYPAALAELRGL